jgi:hypothetical protein
MDENIEKVRIVAQNNQYITVGMIATELNIVIDSDGKFGDEESLYEDGVQDPH